MGDRFSWATGNFKPSFPALAPPGVRSGTAVLQEVLAHRLQLGAARLHTLAVSGSGAADALARRAQRATGDELQRLQVRVYEPAVLAALGAKFAVVPLFCSRSNCPKAPQTVTDSH
jgi:hypothetical protein